MKIWQKPNSGYYLRDVPSPDAELTRTDPNTPMGELMRRFWQPVCLAAELTDLPLAIRILGEDLVAFRDKGGRIGVLARHCTHRGTSLEYGIISERGLRCCYHGWLFDTDGTILETPGEPPASRLKERCMQGAYPAREYEGLIFAYMGPPEQLPEFPLLDTYAARGNRMVPYSVQYPCNWLQVKENFVDPAHAYFLHSNITTVQFSDAWAQQPTYDFAETPDGQGMYYITVRRVDDRVWVRSNHIWLPNCGQVGACSKRRKPRNFFIGSASPVGQCRSMTRIAGSSAGVTSMMRSTRSTKANLKNADATRSIFMAKPAIAAMSRSSGFPATGTHRAASGRSPFTRLSIAAPPTSG